MSKKRVLIVDDEQDIVETIRFNLEHDDYECIVAYDGQEALTLAKSEKPDLILLDIMLPRVNGFKVSRLLKFDEATKGIPIIMITARTQGKDIKLGEETGADAYVTKPFDMNMLSRLVKKCLNLEDEK